MTAEINDRISELEYQLMQCKQLIAAIVKQYGKDSEHGRYLDVNDIAMLEALGENKVYTGWMADINAVRLVLAQESNGEAAPPTTPTTLQTA